VDFEPFKDGEFVESELGLIPKGWRVGTLFDVAEILDKYRKPLSGKDRESMQKIYPYYGATSCMDYVDNYIFDGIYTLIGEDGSVAKEDGLPYMQYVWGKLWVNNHAHILQGKNGFSTEMIHVFLSMTNIQHLVTGAVQAKLSQASMQKILLPIPPSEVLDNIRPIIDKQYELKRNKEEESRRLASLRDTLLPKLMSGELKVNEIEI
jgi:type I restriction enzyme S subunit